MFATNDAVPSALHMCGMFYFPKSPKYLYMTMGDRQAAIDSIRFYQGVDADVVAILNTYDEEKQLSKKVLSTTFMQVNLDNVTG